MPIGLRAHHCTKPISAPTIAPETAADRRSLIGPRAIVAIRPPRGNIRNVGNQRKRSCVNLMKYPFIVYAVNYGIFPRIASLKAKG
jgi:hypothetical protein